jgi:hypothetical protein
MQPEPETETETETAAPAADAAAAAAAAAPGLAGVASLTEQQLEQLLQAMPPHDRKALGDWCSAQRSLPIRPLYHAPQDQYDGQPHTWFVRTLDTGRYARFQWPRMQMHAVPAMVSEEHLFKLSGRIFQQCAIPMAGATQRPIPLRCRCPALLP